VLSQEMRRRMQAAVKAERAQAADAQEHATEPGRRRLILAGAIASGLFLIAAAALGSVVATSIARSPGHSDSVSPAMQRQEAAIRRLAANWIVQQVSQAAVVSCDPVMCAALTADGFPSRSLLALGPTAPYPLTSQLVVVTQAVRDLFGTSLSSAYAPAVLASFGSGDAGITVRVIAPNGVAAYYAALGADLAARKMSGADLLQVNDITVSATAKKQLIAGQVDSRLLLAIAALASDQPIDIVDFGNAGPGASVGIPLRSADLAENDQMAHMASAAYVRSMLAYLGAVSAGFRPASYGTFMLRTGQTVLRIGFTAPSPLGLLSPQ
jgi:hypothetical protein